LCHKDFITMPSKEVYTVIGLMSGTSLDGVDAALLQTDGLEHIQPLAYTTLPYAPEIRSVIRGAFGRTDLLDPRVVDASKLVTDRHVQAIEALLKEAGWNKPLDLIGFHGQTIYHAPAEGKTIQIGNARHLASHFKIQTVSDFRSQDVAQGGQGAPLAPLYHFARVQSDRLSLPCAVLNIGGVSNITYIGSNEEEQDLLAFDCGPGNALMDDLMLERTGQAFDQGGARAAQGQADMNIIKDWMGDTFFAQNPPKSLDRDEWDIARLGPLRHSLDEMPLEDALATLSHFTVSGILKALEHLPKKPKALYLCGGGRLNTHLVTVLTQALKRRAIDCLDVNDLGWNGDALEAECFGYLAVRSVKNLPLSLPRTTGVKEPCSGGVFSIPSGNA
jgi:anhydro-N-acetylmuramic acid kinase